MDSPLNIKRQAVQTYIAIPPGFDKYFSQHRYMRIFINEKGNLEYEPHNAPIPDLTEHEKKMQQARIDLLNNKKYLARIERGIICKPHSP